MYQNQWFTICQYIHLPQDPHQLGKLELHIKPLCQDTNKLGSRKVLSFVSCLIWLNFRVFHEKRVPAGVASIKLTWVCNCSMFLSYQFHRWISNLVHYQTMYFPYYFCWNRWTMVPATLQWDKLYMDVKYTFEFLKSSESENLDIEISTQGKWASILPEPRMDWQSRIVWLCLCHHIDAAVLLCLILMPQHKERPWMICVKFEAVQPCQIMRSPANETE